MQLIYCVLELDNHANFNTHHGLLDCGATSQILDYNVPGGKLNRGMAVYDVLVAILGAEVSHAVRLT